MKNNKRLFKVLTLLLFSISFSLQATTYYMDATAGNDSNSGTSPDEAWRNIEKLNIQTFQAGDSILFKRGEIFRGMLEPQNSGNADNWIVYAAYGEGENPQLLGAEKIFGWTLYNGNIYKKSYLGVPTYGGDGLYEFDDYDQDPVILTEDSSIPTEEGHWYFSEENNGTIYLICSDGEAPSSHQVELAWYEDVVSIEGLSYLEFRDLSIKFGNCRNIAIVNSEHINITNVNSSFQGYYGNPNIFSVGSNYVKIEDCFIYESCNCGIVFYPLDANTPGHHNTVRGCTISRMQSNDGISIHENGSGDIPGNYCLIENNIISECVEGSIDATGDYHIFRNNICFNNHEDSFQIGSTGDHIVIENNICFGNDRHGILAFGNSENGTTGNYIVRNNTVYDNVKHGIIAGGQHIAIYNNTFCNSAIRSEVMFGYFETPTQTYFKNNIVYNDDYNSSLAFLYGSPALIDMNYNNYHLVESDDDILYINETDEHLSLEDIQTTFNDELNSFIANPLFMDLPNKDFQLTANSPNVNAGDFLTQTTSAGSGTEIPVENTMYFCDGFGIAEGDTIQLEGQIQKLNILSIDEENSTITVAQTTSWNAGTGVSLVYSGSAPDIGAYEFLFPVGISQKTSIEGGSIFPNPSKDIIYFTKDLTNRDYQIFSPLGKIVKSGKIENNQLNIEELKTGIYFLEIRGNNTTTELVKLVKK